jgi:hypothetical protein
MKNIFLLPINKPSSLVLDTINNNLFLTTTKDFGTKIMQFQNIYITNDEEIKDGWSYDRMMKSIGKRNNVYSSKIILTTDLELQKDGVQAIDDEFLEWFVKNPSCEVEVESNKCLVKRGSCDCSEMDMDCQCLGYKIITPKEEPKDVVLGHKTSIVAQMFDKIGLKEPKQEQTFEDVLDESLAKTKIILEELKAINAKREMNTKQETLEEAADVYVKLDSKKTPLYWMFNDTFKAGAKWHAERSYSEEEVLELLRKSHFVEQNIDEWFEQFKKK